MLVVIVVAIAGIWIGACIWRRRYLKRKDRMYELGKHSGSSAAAHASWGPGGTANVPYGDGVHSSPARSGVKSSTTVSGAGMFMPAAATPAVYDEKARRNPEEKKKKKKWTVTERT